MFWYWLIVASLFLLQVVFTQNSLNQIRYEELAESVRNVFWLENGLIYDGISSNVGWYGTLLLLYKTFGFTLFAAKYFRLALHMISLICLAALLVKLLGKKYAWMPLLTIGLSPTLLYFNVLQTSYGIDLQYLPIALFLLTSLDFAKKRIEVLKQALAWVVAMVAWLSYPPFAYYLPGLVLLYLWKIRRRIFPASLIGLAAFLLPLLIILFVGNRELLWYDPITQGGLFRGAGIFYLDFQTFAFNFQRTLGDLFVRGASYNFELASAEFSKLFPVLSIILAVLIGAVLFLRNSFRFVITLIFITFALNFISLTFTFDPTGLPGLRRATPLLAALYALFALGWYTTVKQKNIGVQLKYTLIVIFLLLPLHHLLSLPFNLSGLKAPSVFRESRWFNTELDPEGSLKALTETAKKEKLSLKCSSDVSSCRYAEVYSAVQGSCLWNKISCRKIFGFDEKTDRALPLDTSLWNSYYWNH